MTMESVTEIGTPTLPQPRPQPQVATRSEQSQPFASDAERLESFGRALDYLRAEVEAKLGADDAAHIKMIGRWSRGLELGGRGLILVSLDPLSFSLGTLLLGMHKALELMEIGHPALHGAYDNLPVPKRFASRTFRWRAPVDEEGWRRQHNYKHHQFTNIEGMDPDLNFGVLRLSGRVPHRLAHALQPVSNILSGFAFGTALALQASGMLELYLDQDAGSVLPDHKPATVRRAKRAFASKFLRHYGKEYVLLPLLGGPLFPKVLLGNVLSEVGRDVYAAAIIYCGHVGAKDYPRSDVPSTRGAWYAMQVEGTRDVELPKLASILTGALDKQIEHHLFPRLPPNRLREIAPRVRKLCEEHGVSYRSDTWRGTLRSVLRELRTLRHRDDAQSAPVKTAGRVAAA
jgi:NADPH-dependent stearoyl-CoA 9-desaturase